MIKDNIREEATAILTHHIEEKKMRKTPERFAILDVVLNMSGHNSVEDIMALMPNDFPVSRPTIYSTMEMLEELKIVVGHELNGTRIYERAIGRKPHHHYVCTNCGQITDLVDKQIDYVLGNAKTPRFSKDIGIAYIFGLCSKCKAVINKKKKKEERERLAYMIREEKRFMQIDKDLAKMAEELEKVGISGKK